MAKKVTKPSDDNIKFLCGLIRDVAKIDECLDDLNISTTSTFSSLKISQLAQDVKHNLEAYVQTSINGLTHLKKKKVDVLPSNEDAEDNVLYLIKDTTITDDNIYSQYLLIDGILEPLGTTHTNLDNYYEKSEADLKFALLADLQTLINAIGSISELKTMDKTSIVKAINSLKDGLMTKTLNTYAYLSEIGLTVPCSVSDIFLALPDKSMIIIACGDKSSSITDVPADYGLLQIIKHSIGRFSIEYKLSAENSNAKNRKWIGQLKGSDGTGLKWDEIFYTTTNTCNNAVVIEDYLDSLDQDTNCDILFTNNGNTGEIVNLTGYKIFCIEHRKRNNAQMYTQVAYYPAIGMIAQRSKDWWTDTWSPWRKVVTSPIPDVPTTKFKFNTTELTDSDKCAYTVTNGWCHITFEFTSTLSTEQRWLDVIDTTVYNIPIPKSINNSTKIAALSLTTGGVIIFSPQNGGLKIRTMGASNGTYYGSASYPVLESWRP